MTSGAQPDPTPQDKSAIPKVAGTDPSPGSEVETSFPDFWSEGLPPIQIDPALGLQEKLDAFVEKVLKNPGVPVDSAILGARTELLVTGRKIKVSRQGLDDSIVPFIAITGLPEIGADPATTNFKPELRIGIHYSKHNKLSLFALSVPQGSSSPSYTTKPREDIVAALQWVKLMQQLNAIDGWIELQARNLFFSPQPSVVTNLEKQIGKFRVDAARSAQVGDIEDLLKIAGERGIVLNETAIVTAAQSQPPIIERTPRVNEIIDRQEDFTHPRRVLNSKYDQPREILSSWNLQGLRYRVDLPGACNKYRDVRVEIYELLGAADKFREAIGPGNMRVVSKLLLDLKLLGENVEKTFSSRTGLSEAEIAALRHVRESLGVCRRHVEKLGSGYPLAQNARRRAFLDAANDFEKMHGSLHKIVSWLDSAARCTGFEQDSEIRHLEIRARCAEAKQIITGLNRSLRLICPGLFVIPPATPY